MTSGRKISVSWIELLLLVLLVFSGMGAWAFTEKEVDSNLKPEEPKEDYFQRQAEVPILEEKLSSARSELAAVQAKLNEQKIDLAQQGFRLAALSAAHPELLDSTPPSATKTAPPEMHQAYDKAKIELEAAKNLVNTLNEELVKSIKTVADLSSDLAAAQKLSAQKFNLAQQRFVTTKRMSTLLRTSIFIAVFMLTALALTYIVTGRQLVGIRLGVVFGAAALLLLVLLAYQAFEMMGAALIGTLIVIVILILIPRKAEV